MPPKKSSSSSGSRVPNNILAKSLQPLLDFKAKDLLTLKFYYDNMGDVAALIAALIVMAYSFIPGGDVLAPLVTVAHNATDQSTLKVDEFMRYDTGPRDVIFFSFLCVLSVAFYDSVREFTGKKFFTAAPAIDPDAADMVRHLLSRFAFAMATIVFVGQIFVSGNPPEDPELLQYYKPFGLFSQGLGFLWLGAPHAFTMGTKITMLADLAFWTVVIVINTIRWLGKAKVNPFPAVVEGVWHVAFTLPAYLFYYGNLAVSLLFITFIGEALDAVGTVNAVYRAPPPGNKEPKNWKQKNQTILASILNPVSQYAFWIRLSFNVAALAIAAGTLFVRLPAVVSSSELAPEQAARNFSQIQFAVIAFVGLVGRLFIPMVFPVQLLSSKQQTE